MENNIYKKELEMLNSDEFDSLLDAADMMAKSQSNLYFLDKTVSELKKLIDNEASNLPKNQFTNLTELVENMEILIYHMSENTFGDI